MQVVNYSPSPWIRILKTPWNFSLFPVIWGRVTDGAAADSRAQNWMKKNLQPPRSIRDSFTTVDAARRWKKPQLRQTRFTPGTTGERGRVFTVTAQQRLWEVLSSSTSELFWWLLWRCEFERVLDSESWKQLQLRAVVGQRSDPDQHHGQLLHKENSCGNKETTLVI